MDVKSSFLKNVENQKPISSYLQETTLIQKQITQAMALLLDTMKEEEYSIIASYLRDYVRMKIEKEPNFIFENSFFSELESYIDQKKPYASSLAYLLSEINYNQIKSVYYRTCLSKLDQNRINSQKECTDLINVLVMMDSISSQPLSRYETILSAILSQQYQLTYDFQEQGLFLRQLFSKLTEEIKEEEELNLQPLQIVPHEELNKDRSKKTGEVRGCHISDGRILINEKVLLEQEQDLREPIKDVLKSMSGFVTLFHEIRHEYQEKQKKINPLSFESYNFQKDELLISNLDRQYYDDNYYFLSYEVDARAMEQMALLNYLHEITPNLYYQFYKEAMKEVEESEKRVKSPYSIYDREYCERDELLSKLLLENPTLIDEYPVLKYEYKENGERKYISELMLEREANHSDRKLFLLYQEIIRHREYSFGELYEEINDLLAFAPTNDKLIEERSIVLRNLFGKKIMRQYKKVRLNTEPTIQASDELQLQYMLDALSETMKEARENFVSFEDWNKTREKLQESYCKIMKELKKDGLKRRKRYLKEQGKPTILEGDIKNGEKRL